MSDVMRFRHADAKATRRFPVDLATVIEVGDMVWQDADDVKPASSFDYVSANLAGTQANFRRDFVGIAMESSTDEESDDITVATRGVFEMDMASATAEVGDLLAPDDNAAPDALLDQQVIAVGENGYGGIMRVAQQESASTTRVRVEILPEAVRFPGQVVNLPLGVHDLSAAVDLVTDLPVQYPFKAVALVAVVTTVLAGAGEPVVLTVEKDTTGLDDTLTIPAESAVGTVVRQALDDATGDDRYQVGDNLSLASDGGATSGEAMFYLEIRPFLHES